MTAIRILHFDEAGCRDAVHPWHVDIHDDDWVEGVPPAQGPSSLTYTNYFDVGIRLAVPCAKFPERWDGRPPRVLELPLLSDESQTYGNSLFHHRVSAVRVGKCEGEIEIKNSICHIDDILFYHK